MSGSSQGGDSTCAAGAGGRCEDGRRDRRADRYGSRPRPYDPVHFATADLRRVSPMDRPFGCPLRREFERWHSLDKTASVNKITSAGTCRRPPKTMTIPVRAGDDDVRPCRH
jgi:hypothetical protein